MNAQHVTIGGKEVDLTPEGSAGRKSSAATAIAIEQGYQTSDWPGVTAAILGALAALGLLVVVVLWLSRRRCQS